MGGGSSITPSSSGEVYSTDETAIGTWIDGKTLYRKVFTNVTNGYSTGLDSSKVTIISIRGFSHTANSVNDAFNIPYGSTSFASGIFIYKSTGVIAMDTNASSEYVVIEYTKVTT